MADLLEYPGVYGLKESNFSYKEKDSRYTFDFGKVEREYTEKQVSESHPRHDLIGLRIIETMFGEVYVSKFENQDISKELGFSTSYTPDFIYREDDVIIILEVKTNYIMAEGRNYAITAYNNKYRYLTSEVVRLKGLQSSFISVVCSPIESLLLVDNNDPEIVKRVIKRMQNIEYKISDIFYKMSPIIGSAKTSAEEGSKDILGLVRLQLKLFYESHWGSVKSYFDSLKNREKGIHKYIKKTDLDRLEEATGNELWVKFKNDLSSTYDDTDSYGETTKLVIKNNFKEEEINERQKRAYSRIEESVVMNTRMIWESIKDKSIVSQSVFFQKAEEQSLSYKKLPWFPIFRKEYRTFSIKNNNDEALSGWEKICKYLLDQKSTESAIGLEKDVFEYGIEFDKMRKKRERVLKIMPEFMAEELKFHGIGTKYLEKKDIFYMTQTDKSLILKHKLRQIPKSHRSDFEPLNNFIKSDEHSFFEPYYTKDFVYKSFPNLDIILKKFFDMKRKLTNVFPEKNQVDNKVMDFLRTKMGYSLFQMTLICFELNSYLRMPTDKSKHYYDVSYSGSHIRFLIFPMGKNRMMVSYLYDKGYLTNMNELAFRGGESFNGYHLTYPEYYDENLLLERFNTFFYFIAYRDLYLKLYGSLEKADKILKWNFLIKHGEKLENTEIFSAYRYAYNQLQETGKYPDPSVVMDKFSSIFRSSIGVKGYVDYVEKVIPLYGQQMIFQAMYNEQGRAGVFARKIPAAFTDDFYFDNFEQLLNYYFIFVSQHKSIDQVGAFKAIMGKILDFNHDNFLTGDLMDKELGFRGDYSTVQGTFNKEIVSNYTLSFIEEKRDLILNSIQSTYKELYNREASYYATMKKTFVGSGNKTVDYNTYKHKEINKRKYLKENETDYKEYSIKSNERVILLFTIFEMLKSRQIDPYPFRNLPVGNIQSTKISIFAKDQHGGKREIAITDTYSRIYINALETFSKRLCSVLMFDTTTRPDQVAKIPDSLSHENKVFKRQQSQKSRLVFKQSNYSYYDFKKWGQSQNLIMMNTVLYNILKDVDMDLYNFCKLVLVRMINKEIFMKDTEIMRMMKERNNGDISIKSLDNLVKEMEENKDPNKWSRSSFNLPMGMVQGLLQFTSSLCHNIVMEETIKEAKKQAILYIRNYFRTKGINLAESEIFVNIKGMVSSDDSWMGRSYMASLPKDTKITMEMKRDFKFLTRRLGLQATLIYDRISKEFGYRRSVEKSIDLSLVISEYVSLWRLDNNQLTPMIKFVHPNFVLLPTSQIEKQIELYSNTARAYLESGMDLEGIFDLNIYQCLHFSVIMSHLNHSDARNFLLETEKEFIPAYFSFIPYDIYPFPLSHNLNLISKTYDPNSKEFFSFVFMYSVLSSKNETGLTSIKLRTFPTKSWLQIKLQNSRKDFYLREQSLLQLYENPLGYLKGDRSRYVQMYDLALRSNSDEFNESIMKKNGTILMLIGLMSISNPIFKREKNLSIYYMNDKELEDWIDNNVNSNMPKTSYGFHHLYRNSFPNQTDNKELFKLFISDVFETSKWDRELRKIKYSTISQKEKEEMENVLYEQVHHIYRGKSLEEISAFKEEVKKEILERTINPVDRRDYKLSNYSLRGLMVLKDISYQLSVNARSFLKIEQDLKKLFIESKQFLSDIKMLQHWPNSFIGLDFKIQKLEQIRNEMALGLTELGQLDKAKHLDNLSRLIKILRELHTSMSSQGMYNNLKNHLYRDFLEMLKDKDVDTQRDMTNFFVDILNFDNLNLWLYPETYEINDPNSFKFDVSQKIREVILNTDLSKYNYVERKTPMRHKPTKKKRFNLEMEIRPKKGLMETMFTLWFSEKKTELTLDLMTSFEYYQKEYPFLSLSFFDSYENSSYTSVNDFFRFLNTYKKYDSTLFIPVSLKNYLENQQFFSAFSDYLQKNLYFDKKRELSDKDRNLVPIEEIPQDFIETKRFLYSLVNVIFCSIKLGFPVQEVFDLFVKYMDLYSSKYKVILERFIDSLEEVGLKSEVSKHLSYFKMLVMCWLIRKRKFDNIRAMLRKDKDFWYYNVRQQHQISSDKHRYTGEGRISGRYEDSYYEISVISIEEVNYVTNIKISSREGLSGKRFDNRLLSLIREQHFGIKTSILVSPESVTNLSSVIQVTGYKITDEYYTLMAEHIQNLKVSFVENHTIRLLSSGSDKSMYTVNRLRLDKLRFRKEEQRVHFKLSELGHSDISRLSILIRSKNLTIKTILETMKELKKDYQEAIKRSIQRYAKNRAVRNIDSNYYRSKLLYIKLSESKNREQANIINTYFLKGVPMTEIEFLSLLERLDLVDSDLYDVVTSEKSSNSKSTDQRPSEESKPEPLEETHDLKDLETSYIPFFPPNTVVFTEADHDQFEDLGDEDDKLYSEIDSEVFGMLELNFSFNDTVADYFMESLHGIKNFDEVIKALSGGLTNTQMFNLYQDLGIMNSEPNLIFPEVTIKDFRGDLETLITSLLGELDEASALLNT